MQGESECSATSVIGCSVEELEQLMTLRGQDAVDRIHHDYGGVERLCQRLRTDPVKGWSRRSL